MDERNPATSASGVKSNNGNVRNKGGEIAEQAEQRFEQLRGRMGDLNERVVGFIRERPGTAILIALGAGYLIGRILRS
jgi:hypothetical protein